MSGAFAAVLSRIEEAYPGLPPKLRRAAKYALDSPLDVALRPLRELADQVRVGPTTLIRLARELGYSSWDEFRDDFRQGVREGMGDYAARGRRLQDSAESGAGRLIDDWEAANRRNLEAIALSLDDEKLAAAADNIAGAATLYVLGLRSAHSIAFYAAYLARMVRGAVVLVEARHGMLAEEIAAAGPQDVMIAVSFDPYTRETVIATQAFLKRGGRVLAITDSAVSPIADGAAHVFIVPTASPSFYISFAPAMAMVEALAAAVAVRGGKATIDALRRGDEDRARAGVWWEKRPPC